ncbi:hypothetical protein Y023_5130 [Burkholderia pseudomallei A79D]|nr:hypothetical protein Y023_5130 [Burkholderia pseudomallei A79D]KGX97324.1 hypothetical protein X997_4813 [Burkholderia pseudomallei A79C]
MYAKNVQIQNNVQTDRKASVIVACDARGVAVCFFIASPENVQA